MKVMPISLLKSEKSQIRTYATEKYLDSTLKWVKDEKSVYNEMRQHEISWKMSERNVRLSSQSALTRKYGGLSRKETMSAVHKAINNRSKLLIESTNTSGLENISSSNIDTRSLSLVRTLIVLLLKCDGSIKAWLTKHL